VFVAIQSPNHLGCVAETAIALEAMRLGVEVYKPMSEHARADLIFGVGGETQRIQCKSAHRRGDVVVVGLVSSWHSPRGYVRRPYSPDDVDAFVAHSHELDQNYFLPMDLVDGLSAVQLRLSPPRNGQRAAIHFAADFTLSGAVAQLGERAAGSRKVGGSNPPSSTPPEPAPTTVGAHEFRNRFGWYMERAVAGEEIRVTRRGRPYVRIIAAEAARA
jgi:prevent-host-death family protein